jgi:hypothetical protein
VLLTPLVDAQLDVIHFEIQSNIISQSGTSHYGQ